MKKYILPSLTIISAALMVGCNSGSSTSSGANSNMSDNVYALGQDPIDSSTEFVQLDTNASSSSGAYNVGDQTNAASSFIINEEIRSVLALAGGASNSTTDGMLLQADHGLFVASNTGSRYQVDREVLKDSTGINWVAANNNAKYFLVAFDADKSGYKLVNVAQAADGSFTSQRLSAGIPGLANDDYKFIANVGQDKFALISKDDKLCFLDKVSNTADCHPLPFHDVDPYYWFARGSSNLDIVINGGRAFATYDGATFRAIDVPPLRRAYYLEDLKRWIANTDDGKMMTSVDGLTWQADTSITTRIDGVRVVYDKGHEEVFWWGPSPQNGIVTLHKYINGGWQKWLDFKTNKKIFDIEKGYDANDNPDYEIVGEAGLRGFVRDLPAGVIAAREFSGLTPSLITNFDGYEYLTGYGSEGGLYKFDKTSQVFGADPVYQLSHLDEIIRILVDSTKTHMYLIGTTTFAKYDGKGWIEHSLWDIPGFDQDDVVKDAAIFHDKVYFTTKKIGLGSIDLDFTPDSYQKLANVVPNPIARMFVTSDGNGVALLDDQNNFYTGTGFANSLQHLTVSGIKNAGSLDDGFATLGLDNRVRVFRNEDANSSYRLVFSPSEPAEQLVTTSSGIYGYLRGDGAAWHYNLLNPSGGFSVNYLKSPAVWPDTGKMVDFLAVTK